MMVTTQFCLYEIIIIGKFIELEGREEVTRSQREEEIEIMANKYKVSVWDDRKIIEMVDGDGDTIS